MKTKLIGLGILAAVIIAAAAYVFISNSQTVTEINGYVGGEKIGLLEDEEVQDILRDRYRLVIDYAKAGSIDMVTDDAEGRDFLFPSNQTALELYKQVHGGPGEKRDHPQYTHRPVYPQRRGAGLGRQRACCRYKRRIHGGHGKIDRDHRSRHNLGGNRPSQLYGSVSWAPPTRPNPIPAICSPGFWPIPSAAAWRTKAIWRRSCPGCKIFFRSWGIWKAPPRICSISF